ncbi:glutaminyl-peptide cyclotransferase [Rosistilla oblonga]|uniref:glutaminyl-peptide cyclotransferase n=1 Tax=Rosistilla oblonga TaxID=2527990 RepID=UPI003A9851E6
MTDSNTSIETKPAAPTIGWSGYRWLLTAAVGLLTLGCVAMLLSASQSTTTPIATFEVVNVYPHDPAAFTQGLAIDGGRMYEGTGQYGSSSLRRVELASGKVLQSISLNRDLFGEGITVWKDSIIQLTWKKRRAFVFDRDTFQHRKTLRYAGEGWGLTHDGTHLIMSDGSSRLRFLDPETFREVRQITVHDGRRRIDDLNELEFVEGEIFANVWYNDSIARISPQDGRILGWIDLHNLWPARQRPTREHVLNGIAYDREAKRLYVTGKNWPKLYEVRIVDAN